MNKHVKNGKPGFEFELIAKNRGYRYVIGVDEAGRGPLIGPVVAAAVNIPDGFYTNGIKDSKQLSPKKREEIYKRLILECDTSYFSVNEKLVDEINILEATKLAMRNAILCINRADYVLIDGNFLPSNLHIDGQAIINGDNLSVSIAAASIIAKVIRDRMVMAYHEEYPMYGWDRNKGYGTKEHLEAIKKFGITQYHRKSFRGVKEFV